jgi:hypothetical protein
VELRSINGMAPGLQRTPFNSPPLVRLLAALAPDSAAATAPAASPQASLGERLGTWLDWTDAIALAQALNHPPASAAAPASAGGAQAHAQASAALTRVRDARSLAITTDPVFQAGPGGAEDLAVYRRAAQAQQRAMAAAIAPLRAQLRGLLAARTPALAHLAALDATLEAALGERERHGLQAVVTRLEQHFQQLRQTQAPGWLPQFHQTMQQVLLAELDLRLQPAQGLLDALGGAA